MNEAEQQTAHPEFDEADIAAYLVAHPDFLRRHPAALEALELSHASGRAVSLIERQVSTLRASNRQLQARFDELIETARDNEQRVIQLNRLAKVLVSAQTVAELVAQMTRCLQRHLEVDRIYIGIAAEQAAGESAIHTLRKGSAADRALTNVFRRGKPICGPLSEDQSEALFATRSQETAPLVSAAMIPLGVRGVQGVLVLASHESARFVPDMGTLFLELAGELVTSALRRLLGADVLEPVQNDA